MQYIRTSGPSMLRALRPIAAALDGCWWYIGGHGFQMTSEFVERARSQGLSDAAIHAHYHHLLSEQVDHSTPVGRVGRPGFFTMLGDAVDFTWACHFAIEGDAMPLASLRTVSTLDHLWCGPWERLPSDVVLVARDLDAAYQDYGFRDEWMFEATFDALRRAEQPAEAITDWARA